MYEPPGTLFQETMYFKNTLYSAARGFAVVIMYLKGKISTQSMLVYPLKPAPSSI